MLDVAEVTVDLLGGKTTEPTEDRSAETAPAKTDDVVALQAKPAAPTPAKKAAKDAGKAKATAKRPVGVESVSFESVATESSPVVSSPAEVPVVLAIDPAVESAASGAVVPTDKPSVEPTPAASGPTVVAKTTASIMPEDFRQPKAIDKPEQLDDLKLIAGVGPKLEKVLNGLGVWTFAQVAAWTAEETAWVDDYLGLSGRIARDGWVAQADGLAKGMKVAG
jgi:NADH-quinone oxidoreductase subunit E